MYVLIVKQNVTFTLRVSFLLVSFLAEAHEEKSICSTCSISVCFQATTLSKPL